MTNNIYFLSSLSVVTLKCFTSSEWSSMHRISFVSLLQPFEILDRRWYKVTTCRRCGFVLTSRPTRSDNTPHNKLLHKFPTRTIAVGDKCGWHERFNPTHFLISIQWDRRMFTLVDVTSFDCDSFSSPPIDNDGDGFALQIHLFIKNIALIECKFYPPNNTSRWSVPLVS